MTDITTGVSAHIVPTFQSSIGGVPALCCDARTLHAYLRNGKQFSDWFKQRCDQYGFEAGKDFEGFSPNSEKPRGGGRPRTDYHLSLNMAKELSMVESSDKGKEARRYFIECERKAVQAALEQVKRQQQSPVLPLVDERQQRRIDHLQRRIIALQGKVIKAQRVALNAQLRMQRNAVAQAQLF